MASTPYNPLIIQSFADRLYAQAGAIVLRSVLLGVLLGVGVCAVGVLVGPSELVLVGVVVTVLGAIVGWLVGDSRAYLLRLQAQQALCLLQIEINTRGLAAHTSAPGPVPVAPHGGAPHAGQVYGPAVMNAYGPPR